MQRPEFYTGEPVEAADLWFRDAFIDIVWDKLRRQHVLISAPRRTGKTSVMNHLVEEPRDDFCVIYQNVQDLSHPADLFQTILDNFYEVNEELIHRLARGGWKLISDATKAVRDSVDVSVSAGGFKMALRRTDPEWKANWKQHGEDLLSALRKNGKPILLIVDELPDLILNMRDSGDSPVKEFLSWFRTQRQHPKPSDDVVRWLIGGSVNLASTLDELGQVDSINDLAVETLPVLTDDQVMEFVRRMLDSREVPFKKTVPKQVVNRLGRPIPLFLQLATQDLYRSWRAKPRDLTTKDVNTVFDGLVSSQAAQDKLQHYHSRIRLHYQEPKQSAAYAILGQLSQSSDKGIRRPTLQVEFERHLDAVGVAMNEPERRTQFNQLMRDLENDFYVVEVTEDYFDFASGLMKAWWKKYYA